MAGTGLLALLDDITSLLDDIAAMSRIAARKTAGVVGDDLALNANQVVGMRPEREIPVVLAVAKGALLNKAILVPAALAISAWIPWAITPLLLIGGLVLCYEGFHKVWDRLAPADDAARAARLEAVASGNVDMVAFEKARVKGAIRTDFILSAEIVVIALGAMQSASVAVQAAALVAVSLAVTLLVYIPVTGIVKLDDWGLRLQQSGDAGKVRLGGFLLAAAPRILGFLSIAGTTAMFLVGGGIVAHTWPALEHLGHALTGGWRTLFDGTVGFWAGALASGLLGAVAMLRAPAADAAAAPVNA